MTITFDRGIEATTDEQLKSGQLIAVPLLYLDFPTLIKYYSGSNVNVNVSSETIIPSGTYVGVGGISTLTASEETSELKSTSITAELNGLDSTYIALALSEQYYGRDAILALAILNSMYEVVGEPVILFKGFMSVLKIGLDGETKITVEMESILADWERPRIKRYNDASQVSVDPTDTGFNNVESIVNKEVTWG